MISQNVFLMHATVRLLSLSHSFDWSVFLCSISQFSAPIIIHWLQYFLAFEEGSGAGGQTYSVYVQ